jgi:hypothetical protein
MKNIKFLLVLLTSVFISCSDYLDVNTDADRLAASQIGPDKLLAPAMLGNYTNKATTMNQLGNVFMNSWSPNVQQFTGGYSRETGLIIDNTFYQGIFNEIYLNVANFQAIIEKPNADHKNDNYVAVAKILKAFYMQYAVDLYGDVPYTEAFKRLGSKTPKYNDDQFVYRKLFQELDEARALITAANPNAADIKAFDIMLAGNMATWEQFANTVELRMLIRMSENTGAIATYRNTRLAALPQNFLTQDVKINPGFIYAADQLNPFYAFAVADPAGTTVQNYSFIAPSGHFYKALNAYSAYPSTNNGTEIIAGSGISYPNVADPRRGRIFRSGAGQTYVRAVTQGQTSVDLYNTSLGQTPGIPGRVGIGVYNPNNADPSIVGSPTLFATGGKVDGYVITISEVEFLLAEAAVRNYPGFTGDQLHFDAGINASMTYLTAVPGTYVTSINAKPNFGLTASTTLPEKLHAIMYQKWIALMSINGIESYIDYTRTGFPLTPLAIGAAQPRKPKRLIYPSQEYIANSANVPNITPAKIFATTDPSHPFWTLGDPALGN